MRTTEIEHEMRTLDRMVSRRRLLQAAGVALTTAPMAATWANRWWSPARRDVFVSAQDDLRDQHKITGFDLERGVRFTIDVDQRCHQPVLDPLHPSRVVVVARRPGTKLYDVDVSTGRLRRVVECPPGRHVYGHACFAPDGTLLYVTENDFTRGVGVIAVHDAADLRRLGEIPSHGIGPHEIRFLGDGSTLVVANGGILTDPGSGDGREELNLTEMDPSLGYIDAASGTLLGAYRLADHRASIRHLAVAEDDTVAVAIQYEGDLGRLHPLIVFHRGEERLRAAAAPAEHVRACVGYAASVCLDREGSRAAVTCPRGNRVGFYDVASGELAGELAIRDAGGVSLCGSGCHFLVTTGTGELHQIDVRTLQRTRESPVVFDQRRWDNHLLRM
jgi:hypothetical protein